MHLPAPTLARAGAGLPAKLDAPSAGQGQPLAHGHRARRALASRPSGEPSAEPLQGELLTRGDQPGAVLAYLALGKPREALGVPRSAYVDLFA